MALSLLISSIARASANGVLISYCGHNETIEPYWVAVGKGLYQKHRYRRAIASSAQCADLSALVSKALEDSGYLPEARKKVPLAR